MKFAETMLPGAFVIDIEPIEDERGFFARTFCRREFEARGLNPDLAQSSISFNRRKGTLRGMHYGVPPDEEAKIVRCTAGAVYDVIADLRSESSTYGKWVGVDLSADNRRMLYIPKGCAHGFQTFEDNCEIFYQISVEYNPASFRGVRYDAPVLAIKWPLPVTVISERDRALPLPLPV